MWATLTLMSALSMTPGQAGGDLEVSNARVTYGRLGPARKDAKFLPGDVYFVAFDVDGLQFNGGNAKYSTKMILRGPDGKPVYESTQQETELFTIQGGGRVTLDAYAAILTDTKPGEYTLELTISDQLAKPAKTGKLTRKFEVAEKGFGVVRVNCAYDIGGPNGPVFPAPGLGAVGQVLFLHFNVTGFDRDPKTKQPKIKLEVRMLDDKGTPTLKDPVVEVVPKSDDPIPEQLSGIPLNFPLALTKTGKYTLELTATDVVSKKTSTVTYPLTVIEPPK
jgi:hypothetical protein